MGDKLLIEDRCRETNGSLSCPAVLRTSRLELEAGATGGDASEDTKWPQLKSSLANARSGVFVHVLAPPEQDLGESGSTIITTRSKFQVWATVI